MHLGVLSVLMSELYLAWNFISMFLVSACLDLHVSVTEIFIGSFGASEVNQEISAHLTCDSLQKLLMTTETTITH